MATPHSACETCSRPFDSVNPRGRMRRFCDARCRARARRLRTKEAPPAVDQPFATAIRTAVAASGLPLRGLAAALDEVGYDVSASTISQWSRGQHVPPDTDTIRHRLYAFERLVALPTGTLISALLQTISTAPHHGQAPAGQRRRRTAAVGSHPMDQARAVLLERIASVDGSDVSSLVQVEQTEHYVIGRHRMPLRSDMTLQVVALVGDLDRYWHVYAYDSQAPVSVMAHAGCSRRLVLDDIAPVEVAPGTKYQLAATELRFERSLAAGEEYSFSFSMVYDSEAREPVPQPELRRFITTPATRRLAICMSFDPTARPRILSRCEWSPKPVTKDPAVTEPVQVAQDGSVGPLVMTFPKPGSYGYTWQWPSGRQRQP